MVVLPMLRSRARLLAGMQGAMRVDAASPRWSEPEIRQALNEALEAWHTRVRVAHVYAPEEMFGATVYDYALPAYLREPLTVQAMVWPERSLHREYEFIQVEGGGFTWVDLPGWEVEPDGAGGQTLRMAAMPYNTPGRVIWWAPNGPLPQGDMELAAGIDDADTSLTLTAADADDVDDAAEAGFVRVGTGAGAEWMAYAGIVRAGTSLTLQNLVRGLHATAAASHSTAAGVDWGVAVDDAGLWTILRDQARMLLHQYYLTDGAEHERANHERMMQWFAERVEAGWNRYRPKRQVKVRLSRNALA